MSCFKTAVVHSIPFHPGGRFSRMVEERTDGRIKIHIVPMLFPSGEVLWDVAEGRCEIAHVVPNYFAADFPLWTVWSIPTVAYNIREVEAGLNSPVIQDIWAKTFGDLNLIYLGETFAGPNMVWSSKPMDTVDSFKGTKVRVSSTVQLDAVKALGGVPMETAYEEIYSSISRGVVDAYTSSSIFGYINGSYKICKYFNKWPLFPYFGLTLQVNKDAWEELTPELQEIMRGIVEEIQNETAFAAEIEGYYAEWVLRDIGNEVLIPSDEEIAKAEALCSGVVDTWLKYAGPHGPVVLDEARRCAKAERAAQLAVEEEAKKWLE